MFSNAYFQPSNYKGAAGVLRWIECTKEPIVCQGNFSPRSLVCLGAASMEIRGIFGAAVVRRLFQRFAEVRLAFGRLTGAHRFLPTSLLLDFKEKIPHHSPQINPYGDGNSREVKAPVRGFVRLSF
jgi:hypothetical protein